ncbi:uncharacterized protein N7511_002192 [Penicillium nucicola]|uniref:uncharacterized protein n=1 Tax=Penicillium nucicola TaxID=1850975 RepID=UPI0025453268|nr:uncharacterized protein N7511_002192 [Penicillium nucicola]KAJ5770141.1 hypothetical protein N7511_002192 [Penicillium nucicola]
MNEYQASRLISLCALQLLIPTILLTTTSKRSSIRYLAIPCMVWVLKQGITPIPHPTTLQSNSIGYLFISILSATNFLLINPKDSSDFVNADGTPKSFFPRCYEAVRLVSLSRAINTPRQVKNVPGPPAYYAKRDPKAKGIPRSRFLARETSIAAWQFLAMSMFAKLAARDAASKPVPVSFEVEWFVPVDQWIERIISNLIAWFIVARILIDFNARVGGIVCVALGTDSPADSPPTFGNMADSYSLRNYWGKFWHQLLRQPFTSISNFIARDVLCLPRSSLIERYTNVFIVFFLSGLLHFLIDIVSCIPAQESGAMFYFLSFVLGFMIEDGVKAFWKNMYPQAKDSMDPPPLWQRAVGFVWTMSWIGVISTRYLLPMQRPEAQAVLVPFNVADWIGLPALVGIVGVGAALLKLVFEVEI